jgi:hypothetical protein
LRKVFDGKLDLLTFWKSKKSGINCGYIGSNKEDMRIYKKFILNLLLDGLLRIPTHMMNVFSI